MAVMAEEPVRRGHDGGPPQTGIIRSGAGIPVDPARLLMMRQICGLSREDLVEEAAPHLFDYERFDQALSGREGLDARTARLMLAVLDVSPEELLTGLPPGTPASRLHKFRGWGLRPGALDLLIRERGWAPGELTRQVARLWLSRDAVAKLENGARKPKPRTLKALCAAMECSPAILMPGGPPLPVPPGVHPFTAARLAEYNAGMRDWADAQDPPVSYRKPSGGTRYTLALREAYNEFLLSESDDIRERA